MHDNTEDLPKVVPHKSEVVFDCFLDASLSKQLLSCKPSHMEPVYRGLDTHTSFNPNVGI